jgi:hypothetical protein
MSDLNRAHLQAWELIPWIVNRSASPAEYRAAQEHLRLCADCRAELAFQERVQAALSAPQADLGDVEKGWRRLCVRLDDSETLPPRRRESDPERAGASMRATTRWLVAAVVVEAVALGALSAGSRMNRAAMEPPSVYHTLSEPDHESAAATIRVVLAPGMTLEQLRVLLNAAHLQVVAGPGDAGIWSLAPITDATTAATEGTLRELRRDPHVRLAEPIITGSRASAP